MKPKHIGILLIALISSCIMTCCIIKSWPKPIALTPTVAMPPKKVCKIAEVDTTVWFVGNTTEIKVEF